MQNKWIAAVLCIGLLLYGGCPALAAAGAGQSEIEIYDRAGLAAMAANPEGSYRLMADIDLQDIPWEPMNFHGTFEGGGHTLYNLVIERPNATPDKTFDGNHKGYSTYFAGLFANAKNAIIRNLNLLNVDIHITTDQNCFAAGIAGYTANTEISGCSVVGRIYLAMTNRMCGIAGIAGYGHGTIFDSSVDVTLTLVDGNEAIKCEEFLGGVLACGYTDIDHCTVLLNGYASVHGYVHNGGLVGMDHIHPKDLNHRGYVKNCSVDATISFFEHSDDRRAYCRPYIGERLNKMAVLSKNTTIHFISNESTIYDRPLLPETCSNPQYDEVVTQPTCTAFGYTTYTCQTCGYAYLDKYTAPAHLAGDWEIVQQATYRVDGYRHRTCQFCGELLEDETLPTLIPVASCTLDPARLQLENKATVQLHSTVLPADAADSSVVWSSSNEQVVTIDADGTVRAVGPGTAVITCASRDGFAAAECSVTVMDSFWQKFLRMLRLA
ncbi:MAG: Ig-like domain-containing protein [Clostridia bacterium]